MLVIGRKRDEKLIIDGNIEIVILKVGRNHVKFGVSAPRDVPIHTRLGLKERPSPAAGEALTDEPEGQDEASDPESGPSGTSPGADSTPSD